MPWWMTPLLCEVWCAPSAGSRSSTSTRRPRSASARGRQPDDPAADDRDVVGHPRPPSSRRPPSPVSRYMPHQRATSAASTVTNPAGRARRRRPTRRRSGGARRARRCRPTGRSSARPGTRSARPAAPARNASVCGCPSTSVTIGTRRAEQPVDRRRVALAEPGARLEGAEQQVGAGDADHLGGDARLLGEHVGGGDRLGHQRAHHDDRDARVLGRAQPVAAGEHLLARARVQRLVDRPRREPEVGASCRPRGRAAPARAAASTRGPGRTRAPRRRSPAARSRSRA